MYANSIILEFKACVLYCWFLQVFSMDKSVVDLEFYCRSDLAHRVLTQELVIVKGVSKLEVEIPVWDSPKSLLLHVQTDSCICPSKGHTLCMFAGSVVFSL